MHTLGEAEGTSSGHAWSGHPEPWFLICERREDTWWPQRLLSGWLLVRSQKGRGCQKRESQGEASRACVTYHLSFSKSWGRGDGRGVLTLAFSYRGLEVEQVMNCFQAGHRGPGGRTERRCLTQEGAGRGCHRNSHLSPLSWGGKSEACLHIPALPPWTSHSTFLTGSCVLYKVDTVIPVL